MAVKKSLYAKSRPKRKPKPVLSVGRTSDPRPKGTPKRVGTLSRTMPKPRPKPVGQLVRAVPKGRPVAAASKKVAKARKKR